MQGIEHTKENNMSLLELVLQLNGDFRQRLEPIHVTPLQAGLLLFLCRHADASVTEAAAVLGVTGSTLSGVIKDLVRKRWVIKRYSSEDHRTVCLSLSRRGLVMTRKIEVQVRGVSMGLAAKKIGGPQLKEVL
jgi:DNA-binding MarR family transcriptional regulator